MGMQVLRGGARSGKDVAAEIENRIVVSKSEIWGRFDHMTRITKGNQLVITGY
jgi:hypothetical protein